LRGTEQIVDLCALGARSLRDGASELLLPVGSATAPAQRRAMQMNGGDFRVAAIGPQA